MQCIPQMQLQCIPQMQLQCTQQMQRNPQINTNMPVGEGSAQPGEKRSVKPAEKGW